MTDPAKISLYTKWKGFKCYFKCIERMTDLSSVTFNLWSKKDPLAALTERLCRGKMEIKTTLPATAVTCGCKTREAQRKWQNKQKNRFHASNNLLPDYPLLNPHTHHPYYHKTDSGNPVQNAWWFPIIYRRATIFKALHNPSPIYSIILSQLH